MDSYTMHRSYVEAAEALGGDAEELEFRRMIDRYALDGQEPEKKHRFYPLFTLLKPNLDSSCKKRISGAAGAASRWKKPWTKTPEAGEKPASDKSGEPEKGSETPSQPISSAHAPKTGAEDGGENGTSQEPDSGNVVPYSTCKVPYSKPIANRKGNGRGIEREEEVEGECEGKDSGKTSLPSSGGGVSMNFDPETGNISGVTDADVERWRRVYPNVDVPDEIARMGQWLFDNPRRRKKDLRRFAGNWLAEENRRRETRAPRGPYGAGLQAGQAGAERRIGETGGLFV